MAPSTSKKLRVMALHGYTSNAFILQRRMGAIRKACRDVADFVFLNGPHRVEPITTAPQSLDAPESNSSALDDNTPLEEQPRAWWRASDQGHYDGWDETVRFLNEKIRQEGPFDGVLGFSQGAGLAALLASGFEQPLRMQGLELPEGQCPLRFCIAISGFRARDERMNSLFPDQGIQTPVLHVLGMADQIVDYDRSYSLIEKCRQSRIETHESGHVVPSQAPWRNFFRDFIASFQEGQQPPCEDWKEVQSPSMRPKGSHPNSGTATPSESISGSHTPRIGEEEVSETKKEAASSTEVGLGNKSSL